MQKSNKECLLDLHNSMKNLGIAMGNAGIESTQAMENWLVIQGALCILLAPSVTQFEIKFKHLVRLIKNRSASAVEEVQIAFKIASGSCTQDQLKLLKKFYLANAQLLSISN